MVTLDFTPSSSRQAVGLQPSLWYGAEDVCLED